MSSEYKDRVLFFNCDTKGCHKNYECEQGQFRDGWRAAQAEGWVYLPDTTQGNISRAKHFCPEHAAQFDGVRR
jgi:hypothetical protein